MYGDMCCPQARIFFANFSSIHCLLFGPWEDIPLTFQNTEAKTFPSDITFFGGEESLCLYRLEIIA